MADLRVDIHKAFATPILVSRLPEADSLNASLKSVIDAQRANSDGIRRSNIHGWHSDTEMLRWGGEAAKTLGLAALQVCGRYTSDVAMKGDTPRFEMGLEMWANVSPAGASNQLHAHPGALWSAVYYVDDGGDNNDGLLVLLDPRYPTSRAYAPDLRFADDEGNREEDQFRIAPEPGKLVVFPSFVMHSVRPHNGPRDRISIALNILAIPTRRGQ